MLPNMNYEQKKKFWNFVYMDDIEFFYEFIADLSDDEQIRFFEETPDFLSDYLNRSGGILHQNADSKVGKPTSAPHTLAHERLAHFGAAGMPLAAMYLIAACASPGGFL